MALYFELKQQLLDKQAELQRRVTAIEEDIKQQGGQHQSAEDTAILMENDQVLDRLMVAANFELHEIDKALKRINMGLFGICVECGTHIAHERLETLPYVEICAECATALDKAL